MSAHVEIKTNRTLETNRSKITHIKPYKSLINLKGKKLHVPKAYQDQNLDEMDTKKEDFPKGFF